MRGDHEQLRRLGIVCAPVVRSRSRPAAGHMTPTSAWRYDSATCYARGSCRRMVTGSTPSDTTRALVGRTAELDRLAAAFDQAAAGRGGVVLFAGEPGIGKTRLASEFAQHAARRGARV